VELKHNGLKWIKTETTEFPLTGKTVKKVAQVLELEMTRNIEDADINRIRPTLRRRKRRKYLRHSSVMFNSTGGPSFCRRFLQLFISEFLSRYTFRGKIYQIFFCRHDLLILVLESLPLRMVTHRLSEWIYYSPRQYHPGIYLHPFWFVDKSFIINQTYIATLFKIVSTIEAQ